MKFNPLGKFFDLAVGPPGPPGPPGDSDNTVSYPAGMILSGHRAVVIDGSGEAIYASANDSTHAGRVLGITAGSCLMGDPVTIRTRGIITEPSWNWDQSKIVFLSSNGQLTQVPPVLGPGFLQVVGFPVSSDALFVQIQTPTLLS